MQFATAHNGPRASLTTSLFYRNHRPTILGKVVDRSWARVYSWGVLPEFLITLEVKGRRHPDWRHSTALVVAEYNREKYLVSMLGDAVDWVRNVRAAGSEAILRHGQQHKVRLVEVPAAERAPILKAYLKRAIGARPHFAVAWNAPLDAFERVASGHPVFRIEWQD